MNQLTKHCPQCQQTFPPAQRRCPTDGAWLSLPDPYQLLDTVLAGKYRLDALIGIGGMGAVYRAHHLDIERPVAVKILQPSFALDERWLAQFEREAKLAGRLVQENIAAVLDAGRTREGVAYLVLEWLDGVTLQEKLTEDTRFSFARAANVLRQIAAALAAAHAENIIHRDLKPANVMLVRRADGSEQVKVLDFGIAKLADAATAAQVSAPLGTPHYASPEQFQANAPIDTRADIYALGVVLYQMLAGALPFDADSLHELIRLQATAPPPPLRKLRPEAPLAVEQLLNRMLAKDPQQRPSRVADLPALFEQALQTDTATSATLGNLELGQTVEATSAPTGEARVTTNAFGLRTADAPASQRWLARRYWFIAVAVLLVVACALYYWRTRRAENTDTLKTIAILPFKPLLPQPDDEILGAGMTHSLITRLGGLRQIAVRPTDAVMKYARAEFDPLAAGHELEVEALLVGRIQHVGDRLRVTVELINTRDGTPQWIEQFDERFTDIFKVQDEISAQVATALLRQLSNADKQRLAKRETNNPEAYELFSKARFHWEQRTQEGFKLGLDYLQQALEKDPHYALAHAGLGSSYALLGLYGFLPPRDAMPKAAAAAQRALELDETLPEAYLAQALVQMFYDWDLPAAESSLRRALELNPNSASAHHVNALALVAQKRFPEAQAALRQALQLDPRSLNLLSLQAWFHYLARDYAAARTTAEAALAQHPRFFMALQQRGQAAERLGRYDEAIAAFQQARLLSGSSTVAVARLGHAYALAHQEKEARQILAELQASANRAYGAAWIYVGLGEREQALAWLQKAADERASELVYLDVDPLYDGLRSDARFGELLRRVGVGR